MVSKDSTNYVTTRPKAFLNWMVVGEDYYPASSANHVGAIQVPTCNAGDTLKQIVGPTNMVIRRNGWIYIYLSNESNQYVYFDNLVINLRHGPLVEQKDYYAFGMENPVLNTHAIKYSYNPNRFSYNGKEKQSIEFSDSSGLEDYDYGARMYDAQIGRWYGIDQLSEKFISVSPYNFVDDNPVNGIDPDGKDVVFINDSKAVHTAGHGAVIVGNSKDGYYYYSLNGTESHSPVGSSANPDLGTPLKSGPDPKNLLNEANTINPSETHNYDRYVAIKTTPEEDIAIKAKALAAASVKTYCFIGQSCLDVQKSAFSELIANRTGDRGYDALQQHQVLPNTWIKTLPGTFNTLNLFISLGNINANYFQSPKKAVIEILPLEDHTPKAQ